MSLPPHRFLKSFGQDTVMNGIIDFFKHVQCLFRYRSVLINLKVKGGYCTVLNALSDAHYKFVERISDRPDFQPSRLNSQIFVR